MDQAEFLRIERAAKLAIERVLSKGPDDIFKPPIFSQSIESTILARKPDTFRKEALTQTVKFLKTSDLKREGIGRTRASLITKDQNSFRQVAWLDPFDAVKYLALALLLFDQIESARIPKSRNIVHSHRKSDAEDEIFDAAYGYDSFRVKSSELSKQRVGKWKVVTDIANFFDRIGNHSLENHLDSISCERRYVDLVKEVLLFWNGDRRSFGVPVGSDASRILSEAVLLNVDKKLLSEGVEFIRYVDDFRIFAETRADALKSVALLTSLLADEGLTLNSRKTDIFAIEEPEEINQFANRFAGGEHEKINIDEKIEVVFNIRVSGKTSISRFYREPGKDTLKKIVSIPKEKLVKDFLDAADAEIEQQIKLVVKYFVYADQDVSLLGILLNKRVTAIFYIADALVKEAMRFAPEKCQEIKSAIFENGDWSKTAYPLKIPVLRICGHPSFQEPLFVQEVIESHLQSGNVVFYREAISLGYLCLDRSQLRRLALEVFVNAPPLVQRAIYFAIKDHPRMLSDEKRPILRTMEQGTVDWFITNA